MIPSTTNQLLVSEDWKKIYQSFRNADFKSYDFETLRRTMIQYLQEKYPEEFNDYIDSSEYIALIDVIAYLGQNLSFRIDLNARENFLETAQRRDSILRLAQLISYNPDRNTPASGLLKITAIATTDNVYDSNGSNLSNTTIGWNDITNPDWYQQFINIMNSTMSSNFGNSVDRKTIDGIITEKYQINSSNDDVPLFNFSKSINGTSMNFEIVPATFSGKDYIYEDAPAPATPFSIIYKNDNQGSASANTGFFAHFKQGSLSVSKFNVDSPVPNEIIGINTPDINNTDTWLWQLDKNGNFSTLWSQVPSLLGNNVIYNSLNKSIRSIYAVSTRDLDQIDLNFADGIFGDLPKGDFRFFYRQSNGSTYIIKPEQMRGIIISIPYTNAIGQNHSLQLTFSLQYTVTNSAGPESNSSIQTKAPQVYYTQNRMITGEDYNIAPLKAGSDILKIKSINRISSGLSKYFDLSDVSGKYSKTNIFATDGILYKEEKENIVEFEFVGMPNRNQAAAFIKNTLNPIISSTQLRSFYFDNYNRIDLLTVSAVWNLVNLIPNESRGYFNRGIVPTPIGTFSSTALQYVVPGSIIKFVSPYGKYFDKTNKLRTIPSTGIPNGGRPYIWATVKQVIGDGSNYGQGMLSDGTGPVVLSIFVPQGAIPQEVIYKYSNILNYSIETEIANICITKRNFGLTINSYTRQWSIILNSNLNPTGSFSISNQNNVEDAGLDASWLIAFIWTGKKYKVKYRTLNYIFESDKETAFFNNNSSVNYDYTTNAVIKDKIIVLSINSTIENSSSLGYDHIWQIDDPIIESDGYINPSKIKVSFYDDTNTGQILNPNSFDEIVSPQYVYFKQINSGTRYSITSDDIIPYFSEYSVPNTEKIDGQLFYFYSKDINVVKYWSSTYQRFIYTDQYFGRIGRSDIKFQYEHNSGEERRIDPSKSNIIDIYVLTTTYDNDVRSWLLGNILSKPLPPTSQSLGQNYNSTLLPIKAISDEIIFHPAYYKILFGTKADVNLQAKFKAVKNPDKISTDNDLKTKILLAINDFFALENWEFGRSFHFGELSTYIMNLLTPYITNFVIVPISDNNSFGSLYEVTCLSNEIFVSGAQIIDIEIIDAITASQLKASSSIITTSGI